MAAPVDSAPQPLTELFRNLKNLVEERAGRIAAAPPLILFQRLYQAVHTTKGSLDLNPMYLRESQAVDEFLNPLRKLAQQRSYLEPQNTGTTLAKEFVKIIKSTNPEQLDQMMKALSDMRSLLSRAKPYQPPDSLKALVQHFLSAQLQMTLSDPLSTARLYLALWEKHSLWALELKMPLLELQIFFKTLDECLPEGGYLVCHRLRTEQGNALQVELLAVVATLNAAARPKDLNGRPWKSLG
jgi:hypothetical protein